MPPGAETVAFPILGRPFRAEGAPARIGAWLRAHWHFAEHADAPPHPHRVDLALVAPPPTAALAAGEPGEARLHGFSLPWRAAGEVGWTGGVEAGVRLSPAPDGTRIELWGAHDPPPWLFPALYVALGEALRASGLVPLHAAAAARGGAATAFLARSGTGKSTTLIRLARGGWSPLAEDLVWLDPESFVAWGWDRGVHLWPEGRARLEPEVRDAAWETAPEGKLFLPFAALGAGGPGSAPLARMALLERDARRASGWEPLPPRDAVRAVWEATGVPLSPAGRARLSALVPELLRRLELGRLVLGTGPLEV